MRFNLTSGPKETISRSPRSDLGLNYGGIMGEGIPHNSLPKPIFGKVNLYLEFRRLLLVDRRSITYFHSEK